MTYIVLGDRADTSQIVGGGGGQSGGTFEYISIFHKQRMSSQKPRTSLLARRQAGVGILQLDNVIWSKVKVKLEEAVGGYRSLLMV